MFSIAGWVIADFIGWNIVWIFKGGASDGTDWVLKSMNHEAEHLLDFLINFIGALIGFGFAAYMGGTSRTGFNMAQHTGDYIELEDHLIES